MTESPDRTSQLQKMLKCRLLVGAMNAVAGILEGGIPEVGIKKDPKLAEHLRETSYILYARLNGLASPTENFISKNNISAEVSLCKSQSSGIANINVS